MAVPPSVHRVLHDRIVLHKYVQQTGNVLMHLANAAIVLLTVTYVPVMGRGSIFALRATPQALFSFFAVLRIHGDIVAQNRKLFVLGVFLTIIHVYQDRRLQSLLQSSALADLGVHICHM